MSANPGVDGCLQSRCLQSGVDGCLQSQHGNSLNNARGSRLSVPGTKARPDYDLFVREITARNNPFHQPSTVQFPGEYRFHMARTS